MINGFTQFITDFHFLRPWILLLWLLPLLLRFTVLKNKSFTSSWEKVCDAKLLQFLRIKENSKTRSVSRFLILTGLIFSVFAAAGPSWKKQEQTVLTQAEPVMILLNLSSDMRQTDVKPNRLTRAKIEIAGLLETLPDTESGLIVYTDEPFLISPLSADPQLIINLLPAVNFDIMPLNGDRLDRAITLAVEKIKAAGYASGNIVIFSAAAGINFDLAVAAAKKAAANSIKINTVNTAVTDSLLLQQIARAGKGLAIEDSRGMLRLSDNLRSKNENWREGAEQISVWQDSGYYFLFIPLLCCLYFFRKGLLVLAFVISVNANAFAGFFLNDNQEGMRLFTQGNYRQAAEKFKDSQWRGSALYKNGDFAQAAELFSVNDDVEMQYNKGNALAKNGQIEDAIKIYEDVLQKNPQHEDAKFNLEYLKQQQQEQQQSQHNNKDNQQNSEQAASEQQQKEQQQKENQNNQKQAADSEQDNEAPEQQEDSAGSSGAQPEENQNPPQQDSENPDNQQQRQSQSAEEQKSRTGQFKEGTQDEEYNEQAQAREQKFREIPEDKGGLLKAFIFKEYQKNRYGD